jgi:hypothetical protein
MAEVIFEQKTQKKRKLTRKLTGQRQPIDPAAIYNRRDAALVVGCAIITLIRAHNAGHLSGYRVGRYIKHSGRHLLDWFESGGRTGRHVKPEGAQ